MLRTTKSTRTTSQLIDWDAYHNHLKQLQNETKQPRETPVSQPENINPPADNGTSLLAQQVRQGEQSVRNQALGHLGIQIGNLQGEGLAPVERENPQPLFTAFQRHDQLREKLGDRLAQQYKQRLDLNAQMQKQQAAHDLQKLKGNQQLERQQQKQLLDAATSQKVETSSSQTLPDPKPAARRPASKGKSQDQPFRIADTDGTTVKGYWNLSPDAAAQVVQTAIDLGDQAQLDYVARLAGVTPNSDRQTTSARLLALQQKAQMGNADARQRMARLLSAIIPSLKGKKIIDGILKANYSRK